MSPEFLNRIHQGDCVAGMNALPEGCVDLAFADPPFNIGYKYDVYDDRREHEHYIDWSRQWITAVHRVLKPDGTFWLAIGDEYAAELKLASQDIGFHCRSWVVWYYTFGVNCVNKFTRSHAHLFYFVKDPAAFTFRGDAPENRIPSARQLVYNDSRANPLGRLPDDTWILRPQDMADCFTAEEDTWYFPRVAGTFKERAGFHGCQMPEQLLGRIIRCCSREGEVVLDPFSGSATTLVTAKKLGRQFLGFELSEDYAARGAARVAAAEIGAPLVGAADPTRSAPATPGKRGVRAAQPRSGEHSSNGDNGDALPAPEPVANGRADGRGDVQAEWEAAVSATTAVAEISPEAASEPATEVAAAPSGSPTQPLVEAFRRACGGYSLDRVMTDPALQQAFQQQCRALQMPGDARAWNAGLMKLRKAGKLSGVPTTARTELTWDDCEPYLAAAEAAAAAVLKDDHETSLDELFCDPALVAEFDKRAAKFGGAKKSFYYRWTALKLRKEAKQLRERGHELRRKDITFTTPVGTSRARWWKQLPATAGLYLVLDSAGTRLYVGAALDLRARLEKQLAASRLRNYSPARDVRVAVCPLAAPFTDLLALAQRLAVKAHAPHNWRLTEPVAEAAPAPRRERRAAPRRRLRAIAK